MEGRDRRHRGGVATPTPPAPPRTRRRELLALALVLLAATAAVEGWQSWRSRRLAPQIAQAARPGDIQMLSSVTCMYCTQARVWLRDAQVPFDECLIERDASCAARWQALGAPGTPLLLVRGEAQLGFSPQRVAERLAQRIN